MKSVHKITKALRGEEDKNVIFVCNYIMRKASLNRNQLVLVVNKQNGIKSHLYVKGLDKLKKHEIKIDYDSMLDLGIDTRQTFPKSNVDKSVSVDLDIVKASIFHHCLSSLNSKNTLERSSARIAAIGIVNLFYTICIDLVQFIKFAISIF